MDDRITIIEGPPPDFEYIDDGWALGLNEGPALYDLALTRLRTFNGPALVERCYRAWRRKDTIFLHYRNDFGLEEKVPIMAARTLDSGEGQVLYLWIRRKAGEIEYDFDFDIDDDEDEPPMMDN
ncbi:MAG: hypothetical protein CL609_23895 [Anaerolineaceae bacterium]|nr:hypothetical protein [Anaerolineaceae bacterium]